MKKKYLTTPLYYVNGKPHIGHSYSSILVDTVKRYYKLYGYDTIMLTGVDEHGQKVYEAAQAQNMSPKEYCDTLIPHFTKLLQKCDVEHDIFFRTTDEDHKRKVQQILQKLYDKGDIYKDYYEANYCTPCETFFTEKDLIDGKCPQCGRTTEVIKEENYFFNMEKYADTLQKYIEDNPEFIQPHYRRNEVLGILKKGLRPLCISRKREKMSWGIEIPFDKDFVTYVWFDALTNYPDGIGYLSDEEKFNAYWPTTTHFIGKDILLHHTIYWPTMLLGMGLSLPKNIFIHGWWMGEGGQKMSKSLGNVIDPNEIIDTYGASSYRFYLLREMSLGHDGNFGMESFIKRHNTELANDFGNLINRAVHMIVKNFDSIVPNHEKKTEFCESFVNNFTEAFDKIENYLYSYEINKLLDEVMKLIRSTNKYLENTAPWALLKSDKELCGTVLYHALEAVRVCGILLSPVIPAKFKELKKIFPDGILTDLEFGKLESGTKICKIDALFPKLEYVEKVKKEEKIERDDLIEFDDFGKVEIKTVKILKAEKVEGSDRLLYTEVEFGKNDIRKVVAGIAKYYQPQDIVGLHVLGVANLKPAKIRGLDSEGMLLTIKQGKKYKLVVVDQQLPIGKKLV